MSVGAVRMLRGVGGAGIDISETSTHLFALLLLTGAGENESLLRGDHVEPSFPAVPPRHPWAGTCAFCTPLVIAPQEHLILLKGIQWILAINQPALL